LKEDFERMADNMGMALFASLVRETFDQYTWEFLASFEDDLATHHQNCTVSFNLNHNRYNITYQQFCDCFGFSHEGETSLTDEITFESMAKWEHISVHRDMEYAKKKMTTIQNPTIRYFAMFLANTLFARGDIGAMMAPDMCLIHMALHPEMRAKPNLGALLIAHFRRQKSQSAGDIRCGSLITQIAYGCGIALAPIRPVAGIRTMDRNYMIGSTFLGVYAANRALCAYQFYFEPNGLVHQEMLPFVQAFGIPVMLPPPNSFMTQEFSRGENKKREQEETPPGKDMLSITKTTCLGGTLGTSSSHLCSRDITMSHMTSIRLWFSAWVTWRTCCRK
jgi:hypothetical protein